MTDRQQTAVSPLPPSPLEAQLARIQAQLERAGVVAGEPLHDVLVSTSALVRVIDHERRVFVADIKAFKEALGVYSGSVKSLGEGITGAATQIADDLRAIKRCTAQVEEVARMDLRSLLGRVGYLMAGVACLSSGIALLIGCAGGYALGDRRAFGSQLTQAEQLRQTFGIDVLSAQTWAPLIEGNDPRPFVQVCIRSGYRRIADGRRVCEVTLVFPPPAMP